MGKYQRRLTLSGLLLLGLPLADVTNLYAAKPIDLSHENISTLQSFISAPAAKSAVNIEEISRSVDVKQTLHVRIQETYAGYPVWGADAIVHIPNGSKTARSLGDVLSAAKSNKGSMDGTLYQHIQADLSGAPAQVFSEKQAEKALHHAIDNYQHNAQGNVIKDQQTHLIVYMDENHKAHWAYQVKFYVEPAQAGKMPAKPVYILDAVSFQVYEQWNDIKTIESTNTFGGGFGGNEKMGKLIYDGMTGHLPKLNIRRDGDTKKCFMQNDDVIVNHYRNGKLMSFACETTDRDHNNLYWDGDMDAVNGGYSPTNDALFGGAVIKEMYQKWYGIPVLLEDGKPMILTMVVHYPIDNAFWDGKQMTFGDGETMFYPLTSLGVAAHEISHGFTEQHSNLTYSRQSGGMNEAFSDMAAQGAEFYAYGKNSWQIGPEIFKAENEALRYMDKPSRDCNGRAPGSMCSIDHASQYHNGLDVHYSSGVYNRFFYLLGTSAGWDTKKAFDVMVHANMHYWTSQTNFTKGACGVMKATKDLGYDTDAVMKAFNTVGIDADHC